VSTGSLSAIGGTRREAGIAFAAYLLVTVVFGGQDLQRGLNNPAAQTENEMERRLLLDVVITESPSILELLSGKDETLLVGGNSFLVLNFGLYVVDGVRGLHLEGDRLPREGFDENLHIVELAVLSIAVGLLSPR